jgi:hypothetical protein
MATCKPVIDEVKIVSLFFLLVSSDVAFVASGLDMTDVVNATAVLWYHATPSLTLGSREQFCRV